MRTISINGSEAMAAARHWVTAHGVGPFFVRPHIPLTDVIHRGEPAVFDHTSAYAQWGSIMVELVQDHGTGPSAVRDLYGPGESGLHHMAFFVDDLDATIAALGAAGHELVMSARTTTGMPFHFVDAVATHGHLFELYAPSPRMVEFYAMVAGAARGWDGTDPVRLV